MINLGDNKFLVETVEELPRFTRVKELFADCETQSWNPRTPGDYPYHDHRAAGWAVSADDDPRVFYVPYRHSKAVTQVYKNLPEHAVKAWLKDCIGTCENWINHNLLFDASFAAVDGAMFNGRLIDTLTAAKLIDTDRWEYGLKPLAADWLGESNEDLDRVKVFLEGIGSKNYADVPADIMGDYACGDVRKNRRLYRYIQQRMPTDMYDLWEQEIKLTPVLFDMEWDGLRVDPLQLKKDKVICIRRILAAAERIKEITDYEFTNSNACLYEILINQLGLPVLAFKDKNGNPTFDVEYDPENEDHGNPTFNKDAIALYKIHPAVTSDPKLVELMEQISIYRKESQHLSLFVDPYLELMDANGRIHPSYNQLVRTGRMSARRPNSQQLNARAKRLIIPDDGFGFMANDFSQIEFRLIVHYANDYAAIKAYNDNPDTDFHQWIADNIGIQRKAGKTINFSVGYGAGKRKVTKQLAANPDIIEAVSQEVSALVAEGLISESERNDEFQRLCFERASSVYEEYHERMPGIKRVSYEAARTCRYRGFVFNAYKRRRYLPKKAAHKAFNSIVQGCAMDVMKDGMVRASPRYNEKTRALGVRLAANVHDDILSQIPKTELYNPDIHNHMIGILENPTVKFRVPIRTGLALGPDSWYDCTREGSDIVYAPDGSVLAGKVS